jgi:hypothetical protein
MPNKDPKPKWGYDNSTARKRTYHLEDHQKQKIEKMLNVKIDEEMLEEFNRAGGRVFLSLDLENKPRASNIKPPLKVLIEKFDDIMTLMNALDSETKGLINEGGLNLIEKLEETLIMITHRCEWLLEKKIKDLGGHPEEIAQNQFIYDLSLIYKRITGKDPRKPSYRQSSVQYYGLFFDFCWYCFKTLNLQGFPHSKIALGSAIRRVL